MNLRETVLKELEKDIDDVLDWVCSGVSSTPNLLKELVAIALDDSQNTHVRCNACGALQCCGESTWSNDLGLLDEAIQSFEQLCNSAVETGLRLSILSVLCVMKSVKRSLKTD